MKQFKLEQDPFFIFSSPRTGSTVLCYYLEHYLRSRLETWHVTPCLYEFFNFEPLLKNVNETPFTTLYPIEHKGRIFDIPIHNMSWVENQTTREFEAERRIKMLKVSREQGFNYFFKIFAPDFINDSIKEKISNGASVLFLERQNKVAQFLSFTRSRLTGDWHIYANEERSHFRKPPLTFIQKSDYDDWMQRFIYPYERHKTEFISKAHTTLYYEDFRDNIHNLQKLLELSEATFKMPPYFVKEHAPDHSWVKNLSEVESWFLKKHRNFDMYMELT